MLMGDGQHVRFHLTDIILLLLARELSAANSPLIKEVSCMRLEEAISTKHILYLIGKG